MAQATVTVLGNEPIATIRPEIYSHFAEHLGRCIYDGMWVGPESPIPNIDGWRTDIVEALRKIKPPVLRWPGGCYADDYHWRNGIGPAEDRPKTINLWWGKVIDDNAVGTHEFIRLCELIGAKPYLCGNMGSATPQEMREWLEYCNYPGDSTLAETRAENGSSEPFDVEYWGVGNENWGCGGNMTPDEYAAKYRQYSTFMHDMSDTKLFLIACGPNGNNPDWTRRFMDNLSSVWHHPRVNGFAAHYYCGTAGTATEYDEAQWYQLVKRATVIEDLIIQQRAVLDGYDPKREIGLIIDEWGTWHPVEEGAPDYGLYQQNTMRDAIVAALSLNTFNRHADKVVMTNIAQIVNVLQAMILTQGAKMLLTPTYHVYAMYTGHQGAKSLRALVDSPMAGCATKAEPGDIELVSASASIKGERLLVTLANLSATEAVDVKLSSVSLGEFNKATATMLGTGDIHAYNSFENPESVKPACTKATTDGDNWVVTMPAGSVCSVILER